MNPAFGLQRAVCVGFVNGDGRRLYSGFLAATLFSVFDPVTMHPARSLDRGGRSPECGSHHYHRLRQLFLFAAPAANQQQNIVLKLQCSASSTHPSNGPRVYSKKEAILGWCTLRAWRPRTARTRIGRTTVSSRTESSVPSRSCQPRTPRGAWPASSCWHWR